LTSLKSKLTTTDQLPSMSTIPTPSRSKSSTGNKSKK
jgi:hypothetical protein